MELQKWEMDNFLMGIWLLEEWKTPESLYKPYLDILPKSFDSHPLFYSIREKELLEGSILNRLIYQEIQNVIHTHTAICNKVEEIREWNSMEFGTAYKAVTSRAFGITVNN